MYKHSLTLFLMLFFAANAAGQGWERVLGGGGLDQINAIAKTPDDGFVMTGLYSLNQVYLLKTDVDGNLQWSKTFNLSPKAAGTAVVATRDTGYAVAGYIEGVGAGARDFFLLKTDTYGNFQWLKTFGGPQNDEATGLVELADGSLVIAGFTTNYYIAVTEEWTEDVYVIKTDKNGDEQWAKTVGQPLYKEKGNAITLASNGDLVIAGSFREQTALPGDVDFFAARLKNDNEVVWTQTFGFAGLDDNAKGIAPTTDGHFVLAGRTTYGQGGAGLLMKINGNGGPLFLWEKTFPKTDFNGVVADKNGGFFVAGKKDVTDAQGDLYITRVNGDGNMLCEAVVGKAGPDESYGVVATDDGGAAAAGFSYPFFNGSESNAYLVKADLNCLVFTSYIKGNIFRDLNLNCQQDNGELGLEDWIVSIKSPNFSRFAVANQNGDFRLAVDTGSYNVTLFAPNDNWKACDAATKVSVPEFYDTVEVHIPAQALIANCPRNEVDVATAILRQCTNNVYTVRYCNSGTAPSLNTRVEVTFDPSLTVTGSSIFGVEEPLGSNTYVYQIGMLNNGDCGSFTVTAFLDCDNIVGQTHCVSAHIYPDSFCNPGNWNGAFITARGECNGDSVYLVLRNTGTSPTSTPLGYVIAEDLVMLTAPGDPDNVFDLDSDEEMTVFSGYVDGKTYRVIADQEPTYPGTSIPTAAVEACISDTSMSQISLGYYTMFPEDDADAFVESDCQESYETDYNPTYLKRGHPKGYDVAHYISPETDLDFLIQFRNTGTDTVKQVIVRDTLSAALDPATVHPGAASHAYDFEVYGPGIVQFTLPNANLAPGSSASEGFVKFRVSQKPSVECETKIFNSAAIYFDFSAPVITNETFHTVCEGFVTVITDNPYFPNADVRVYPNPFDQITTFEIKGVQAQAYRLELYDAQGRLLSNAFFNHPTFRLFRHQLPDGVFFYRLTADGKPVASGKLIAQ